MSIIWTTAMKRRIERNNERGLRFLQAMSNLVAARLLMEARGYTPEVHRRGFELFFDLISSRQPWEEDLRLPSQEAAIAAISQWAEENLGPIRTTLANLYREQEKYVFYRSELLESHATLIVRAILERIETLREGTDPYREESREADRAAIELLETRNLLDRAQEGRLKAQLEKAFEPDLDDTNLPEGMETDDESYLAKAERFHAWLKDWRDTARSVIKNRRHLIRLGLKHRGKK